MIRDPVSGARLVLRGLASALLVLAVLRPPETYPWSGAVCAVLLAAAAWSARGVSGAARVLPAWTAWLLPLACAAVLLAACRARAVDEATLASALLLAACTGGAIARDPDGRAVVSRVLAALGSVAAVLAILQAHVTYGEELRTLLEGQAPIPAYMLARLRDGRPGGPFALPAALAGFFALTLPLTLHEARLQTGRGVRAALAAAAVLQVYALFLTRSVGGLAAAALSLWLSLPALATRSSRALRVAVAILALVVGLQFLAARRQEINAPGGDPFLLRVGNWRAAAAMIRDHPLFGIGPGSFGTFYPRYMKPGMNETRYAHNSYLQAIAGWGAWTIVPLAGLLLAFGRRLRGGLRRPDENLPVLAAGAAFLAHNLCDFTAYLPGAALPGALLVGMGLRTFEPTAAERDAAPGGTVTRRPERAAGAVLATALAVFAIQSLAAGRSADRLQRARETAIEGGREEALSLARKAARARPSDPAPRAFIAEWVLANGMTDATLRAEGRREAESAVRLDPESAILHYDLSLFLRDDRETAPAYRELAAARALFPLKEDYRLPQTARSEGTIP